MAPPTTKGGGLISPSAVLAFGIGAGIGGVLVAPVIPDAIGDWFGAVAGGAGGVILVGVGALGVLMVLLAVFYQLYL